MTDAPKLDAAVEEAHRLHEVYHDSPTCPQRECLAQDFVSLVERLCKEKR